MASRRAKKVPIRVAVIGYGYWGPNLVRNFMEADDSSVAYVCDKREERLGLVAWRYPAVQSTTDPREAIENREVDAVAVATPVSTHFELAMRAMQAGKHVLVEKPLAETVEQCETLIDEAEKHNLVLFVDHTFPYTGAVRKIKELIDSGQLGEIYYYDSVRINLGLFQHDVSVIWDLAVHDIAIMDHLISDNPVAVSATAMSHVEDQPANVAYLTFLFSGKTIAHIHVNWLAPVKVRQTIIGGSRKMVLYDDLEPTEKVKVYDRGVQLETDPENIYHLRVGYRTGDMWAPKLDDTEALRVVVRHFNDCVLNGKRPVTDGKAGLRVVKALRAATESAAKLGSLVKLD